MGRLWNAALGQGDVLEDELRTAALALTCSQVLYYHNTQQRRSYQLIRQYRTAFAEVLEHLGLRVMVDDDYRMAYAVPDVPLDRYISMAETLLALTLRKIHHDVSLRGEALDGVARISIADLYAVYHAATQRELPKGAGSRSEFDTLIDSMRRFGFVRRAEPTPGSEAQFDIQILPGIAALISEDTLLRLTDSGPTLGQDDHSLATSAELA